MAKVRDRIQNGILGDINPRPSGPAPERRPDEKIIGNRTENDEAMDGGSRHDDSKHTGSRDVTEGVTGGLGTEVGGSGNYRQGTGTSGGDIGNRPE
jgi:hypothetical protein